MSKKQNNCISEKDSALFSEEEKYSVLLKVLHFYDKQGVDLIKNNNIKEQIQEIVEDGFLRNLDEEQILMAICTNAIAPFFQNQILHLIRENEIQPYETKALQPMHELGIEYSPWIHETLEKANKKYQEIFEQVDVYLTFSACVYEALENHTTQVFVDLFRKNTGFKDVSIQDFEEGIEEITANLLEIFLLEYNASEETKSYREKGIQENLKKLQDWIRQYIQKIYDSLLQQFPDFSLQNPKDIEDLLWNIKTC